MIPRLQPAAAAQQSRLYISGSVKTARTTLSRIAAIVIKTLTKTGANISWPCLCHLGTDIRSFTVCPSYTQVFEPTESKHIRHQIWVINQQDEHRNNIKLLANYITLSGLFCLLLIFLLQVNALSNLF